MTPLYIRNQAEYYQQIAQDHFETISKAKTKQEYDEAMSRSCIFHRRDFCNPDVMQYYLESGIMEPEEVEIIKQWYIQYAGDFQKTILSANLKVGEKYTLVYLNEFGFPVAQKIVLQSVDLATYAQHDDVVLLTFKPYRKRSLYRKYFYDCSLSIYQGWRDLKESDIYNVLSENDRVTVKQSKYGCFDARFYEDIVKSWGDALVNYRKYKVRKSDGKVFA